MSTSPGIRKLVVLELGTFVRDFAESGALDEIGGDDTFLVCGSRVKEGQIPALRRAGTFLGRLPRSEKRVDAYQDARRRLLTHYRFRSRTARIKHELAPPWQRWSMKLKALPGIRHLAIRRALRRTGLNQELHRIVEEIKPDIIIVPSQGGPDTLVLDAVRSGRELGIPVLAPMYNWDNLSSKAAFVLEPDYITVSGDQAVRHARDIHGIPPDRVRALGSPYIDRYYHRNGNDKSPFPFRYVLFAGCYARFDELTPVRVLSDAIEKHGLDLKVVYRPHPRRSPRLVRDFVDEEQLPHVVVDPQLREAYLDWWERADGNFGRIDRKMPHPPLEDYPALLENALFVVCPLSTMMLEAAAFERQVLVLTYDDGVHPDSPHVAVNFMHFEGVDEIDGFEIVDDVERLEDAFVAMTRSDYEPRRPMSEQTQFWIHHDERRYGERLAEYVEEIVAAHRAELRPAEPRPVPEAGVEASRP